VTRKRFTNAQLRLLAWAKASPGREVVCPVNPAGECGRRMILDGRDDVGRYRVRNGSATAWALLDRGLLRRSEHQRDVYEAVDV
jgi:hypothetical protein